MGQGQAGPVAVRARIALAAVVVLLSACAIRPAHPPSAVIETLHSGGSQVAFSTDAMLLASGGWEGRVQLWSVPDGAPRDGWQAHQGAVNGLAFLRNGDLLTAGLDDASVARWSRDGRLLQRVAAGAPVTALVLDEDAGVLLTGHRDGQVRYWQFPQIALRAAWQAHRSAIRALAWHPARQVASSGADGQVLAWALDGEPRALARPLTAPRALTFSPDGRRLYGGGWFNLFRWQLPEGAVTVLRTEHRGIIKGLRFTPDGGSIASISRQTDSAVYFLDPETGATQQRMLRQSLCGGDITLSRDGRFLATTGDDAVVRIWDREHLLPAVAR